MRQGVDPDYRILGLELATISLADAQEMGLEQEDSTAFENIPPEERQLLSVSRIFAGFDAEKKFEGGDLILKINGQQVTRFAELELLVQQESLEVTVLRDGEKQNINVQTRSTEGRGIDRVLQWQGALLHRPHFEVSSQRAIPQKDIYISFYAYGSPASKYGLRATRRIVAIDEQPTPDLDAFLNILKGKKSGDSVRIQSLSLDNQVHVNTLELDHHYWPTREFRFEDGQWVADTLPINQSDD
jgi:S1-C subfamily serine protease